MDDHAKIILERRPGYAVLRLNNPGAMNAVDAETGPLFAEAVERVAADPALSALIIHGEGGVFCAGGDLKNARRHLEAHPGQGAGPVFRAYTGHVHRAVEALLAMPQVVICAVDGPAAGAGLAWLLCADLAVAAEGSRIVPGFLGVGLTPAAGTSRLLAGGAGPRRAAEMLLQNQAIDAARALELGLINAVCQPGGALAHAEQWAAELAQAPAEALAATKALLNQNRLPGLSGHMATERRATAHAADGPEFRRLIQRFFKPNQADRE